LEKKLINSKDKYNEVVAQGGRPVILCECGVYSIDLKRKEIADFAANVGLNFMAARSKKNVVGTNFCYVCFNECSKKNIFIFRIHQFDKTHKNENICINCMNQYLRSFYKLNKDDKFQSLFDNIDEAKTDNPYLSDVFTCPFQDCKKPFNLEGIKSYYLNFKENQIFVENNQKELSPAVKRV
jgi:hypothetical protein